MGRGDFLAVLVQGPGLHVDRAQGSRPATGRSTKSPWLVPILALSVVLVKSRLRRDHGVRARSSVGSNYPTIQVLDQ